MVQILTYEQIDRQQWSKLVRESETGTWFQSPEAFLFFSAQKDLFEVFVLGIAAAYPQQCSTDGHRQSNRAKLFTREGKGEETTQVSFAKVWGTHTADSTQYKLLEANARENRNTPTEAESVLWDMLKSNGIGLHFRRQHVILDYIVDFVCIEKGLIIELDGGYHDDPEQKEKDERRTAHLTKLGYTELRFTNEELLVDPEGVINKIKATAANLPSLQGRTEDRPELRGLCVGYVTKEKNPIKQFFTRRAIITGGPMIANDATSEEVETLMKAVRHQFDILDFRFKISGSPIYIETRNFNDYSRWREAFEAAGFEYKKHLNFHVDCTNRKAMDARLSDTRRKQIRRAQATVECITNESVKESDIREWYGILQDMYRTRVKTPLWPEEFFIHAYRSGEAKYIMVKHEGRVIGGLMLVEDEKTVYEWFECGLDTAYERQYPSVMATYAGMVYAAEHGIARCDFMGAGEPGVPYGVRDFKERFGGRLVEHGRFLCIQHRWLYRLGTMGVRMMKHFRFEI